MKIKVKCGFTLLELMLSVVILTMGFCGVTLAISKSRKNLIVARIQRIANEVASGELDQYRNISADETPIGTTSTSKDVGQYRFSIQTTISRNTWVASGGTLSYECFLITVRVSNNLLPSPILLHTVEEAL